MIWLNKNNLMCYIHGMLPPKKTVLCLVLPKHIPMSENAKVHLLHLSEINPRSVIPDIRDY